MLVDHQRHIRLEYQENSATVDHSIIFGHPIQLHHTVILSTDHRDMVRIIMEAIVKGLLPNYMKNECGISLRKK
jgi:hypothetical protein